MLQLRQRQVYFRLRAFYTDSQAVAAQTLRQVLRSIVRDQLSLIDHYDAVAHGLNLRQDMRRKDHCMALSKALDQVSTTVANVRTLYSGQPNYSGLNTEIAIKMGAIGAEMLSGQSPTSAKVAYNAFNGEVTRSATTVSGRANAGFTLVFSGLSKEACVQMASSDWGSGSGSGLVSVQAGTATAGTTASGTLPLNLATAAGGCNQEGDSNKVTWVYY